MERFPILKKKMGHRGNKNQFPQFRMSHLLCLKFQKGRDVNSIRVLDVGVTEIPGKSSLP